VTQKMVTSVVVRTHQHYQTCETLEMYVMKAFVGADPQTVERAAISYASELRALGKDKWLAGLPEYERRNTVVLFEAMPVEQTEMTERRTVLMEES
jgi:hypothetical protein